MTVGTFSTAIDMPVSVALFQPTTPQRFRELPSFSTSFTLPFVVEVGIGRPQAESGVAVIVAIVDAVVVVVTIVVAVDFAVVVVGCSHWQTACFRTALVPTSPSVDGTMPSSFVFAAREMKRPRLRKEKKKEEKEEEKKKKEEEKKKNKRKKRRRRRQKTEEEEYRRQKKKKKK